jgi:orotate phosphoribosyltransferase
MMTYQKHFIQQALASQALQFGKFELKSGRISPYFFNAGMFNDGASLCKVAQSYADRINQSGIEFDVIFGPAYKGIPLASMIAAILATESDYNVGLAYDRKEIKNYGEGGSLVGSAVQGKRILIIDDVISAGTAINEAISLLHHKGAHVVGVCVALDRQEIAPDATYSAIQAIENRYRCPVFSIITLNDLITFLDKKRDRADLNQYRQRLKDFRAHYGI